jgi:diketogulonate reductase-like aldo/keto reductase/polysaccharide pyruvyl transferase WcaK-like protein
MPCVRLNTGADMPLVGLGTYPMRGLPLGAAVVRALRAGYRRFDTASAYGNERGLGMALKTAPWRASREPLFLTTKLSNREQREGTVRAALAGSLRRLGVPRVDLYLMHWPLPDTFTDSWRQMEELFHEGAVGAIGVCNCHPHHLDRLLRGASVVPAVNQVELHPLLSQKPLLDYCQARGIVVEAYSPFARMHPRLVRHPDLMKMAERYGKTVPQIILRWDVQQGIPAAPKTSHRRRLAENLAVFDFELTGRDMEVLDGLNEEFRVRYNPDVYPVRNSKPARKTLPDRTTDSREILLYGHGGSANRGCEAIVRSTSALLKAELGAGSAIRLMSFSPQEDREAGLPDIDTVADSGTRWPGLSPVRLARALLWRALPRPVPRHVLDNLRTLRRAGRADVCLSVGGDNYCYDPVEIYYGLNRLLRKRCRRMVLWGCSIEPDRMDHAMQDDLRGFDLITARESITHAALRDRGLEQARLFPDPAFAMKEERLPLPSGWREGEMVGINLSALIEQYERRPGGCLAACAELIRHVLSAGRGGVVLVPHVTGRRSDDRFPLGTLYREFRTTGRVLMLPGGLNAPETKGYVSRCRLFVGARTHATIAAYSSGVPALVLGYSVKARGIARDLFGDEKGLVLPVQEMEDPRQLIRLFDGLREREGELRARLGETVPEARRALKAAGAEIRRLAEP